MSGVPETTTAGLNGRAASGFAAQFPLSKKGWADCLALMVAEALWTSPFRNRRQLGRRFMIYSGHFLATQRQSLPVGPIRIAYTLL